MRNMLAVSFFLAGVLCCALQAKAEDKVVNVYNWSEYIAQDTVANFEKQSGIKVRYDVYDSDDTLQAKLLAGGSNYDVVVPGSAYMAHQITAGIYLKLDKSKIPNLVNLDPVLMKMVALSDPGNRYGVPYTWGSTGIGMNVADVTKILGKDVDLDSWDLMMKPDNLAKLSKCGVSVLDSPTDVFPVVLRYLGKNPNSEIAGDYQAAYDYLKTLRPYISQFNSASYIGDLANNDICIALGWSGDVLGAEQRAKDAKRAFEIRYVTPASGAPIWFGLMAIPAGAGHVDAAYQWINYILQPEVHAAITNEVFYPNGNLASKTFIKPELANNPQIFPTDAMLATMYPELPVSADIMRLRNRLWQKLKSGV